MKENESRDWLQIIGQFGVVASLLFVGMQMKQDQEIAIAATYQARAAAVAETLVSIAENKEFLTALWKTTYTDDINEPIQIPGTEDFATPISGIEYFAALYSQLALWQHYDNAYYQYQQGFLPETHWLRIRAKLKFNIATFPFDRYLSEGNLNVDSVEFRQVIFDILTEIDSENSE